jgi:hypothetical protein
MLTHEMSNTCCLYARMHYNIIVGFCGCVVANNNLPNLHLIDHLKFGRFFLFENSFQYSLIFFVNMLYVMILLSIIMFTIFRIENYFIMILVHIDCNFHFFEFHEFKHEIQNSISKFSSWHIV